MPEDRSSETKAQIPTNLRLLLLVEEVAKAGVPVSPAKLAEAIGLPKPTVHRLLSTAEEEGFLQRDVDGRSFGPGKRLRRLSGNTLSSQRVRTERLLIMQDLAKATGETCNLAAPSRDSMVYIDRVETHWPLRIQLPIGTRVPFHCTASGKMYLSSLRLDKLDRLLSLLTLEPYTERTFINHDELRTELSETRGRGFATDDCEFMDGMAALAVAIRDTSGRLLTTLSIHAPDQRSGVDGLIDKLPLLSEAARALERLLDQSDTP